MGYHLLTLSRAYAYMFPRYQARGLDCIVVESAPLVEAEAGKVIILWGIPLQHVGTIWQADTTTKRLDCRRRVIQHVVRIDYTDLMHRLLGLGLLHVQVGSGRNTRSDQSLASEVVEVSTQLVVPGLERIIVIEPCDLVQGRDRASVVRRHAEVRIADQECEVESLLDLTRHHCWVARLGGRIVRVGLVDTVGAVHSVPIGAIADTVGVAVDTIGRPVHRAVGAVANTVGRGVSVGVSSTVGTIHAIGLLLILVGAHTALDTSQRGSNAGGLAIWREQIVVDILDENSLSL